MPSRTLELNKEDTLPIFSPAPIINREIDKAKLKLKCLEIASKFSTSFEDMFIKEKQVYDYIIN